MPVDRLLPTVEGAELVALVREIAAAELAPRAATDETAGRFPRDVFRTLGDAGVLGLPFPDRLGGSGQPYEVYLQALEEIAAAWMSVGIGISVHVMSLVPLEKFGTREQQEALLPQLIAGDQLGAYALSEAQAGSDIAAMTARAKISDDGYALVGSKAWITHSSVADFYTTFARTGDDRRGGISCFLVAGDAPGLSFGAAERKMGLTASTTAALYFDQVPVSEFRRIGEEGEGMKIALAALDRAAGRPFSRDASVAKMMATDTAMRVATDAVQVLGGYGYTRDYPAERYLREAK